MVLVSSRRLLQQSATFQYRIIANLAFPLYGDYEKFEINLAGLEEDFLNNLLDIYFARYDEFAGVECQYFGPQGYTFVAVATESDETWWESMNLMQVVLFIVGILLCNLCLLAFCCYKRNSRITLDDLQKQKQSRSDSTFELSFANTNLSVNNQKIISFEHEGFIDDAWTGENEGGMLTDMPPNEWVVLETKISEKLVPYGPGGAPIADGAFSSDSEDGLVNLSKKAHLDVDGDEDMFGRNRGNSVSSQGGASFDESYSEEEPDPSLRTQIKSLLREDTHEAPRISDHISDKVLDSMGLKRNPAKSSDVQKDVTVKRKPGRFLLYLQKTIDLEAERSISEEPEQKHMALLNKLNPETNFEDVGDIFDMILDKEFPE